MLSAGCAVDMAVINDTTIYTGNIETIFGTCGIIVFVDSFGRLGGLDNVTRMLNILETTSRSIED